MKTTTPTRGNVIFLKQLLNLIPRGTINRLGLQTGVQAKARSFSVRSHLAAMINPLPALRSGPTAVSGASPKNQIPWCLP